MGLFLSHSIWAAPTPLSRHATEIWKTNHPVMFVHGFNSSSEIWGGVNSTNAPYTWSNQNPVIDGTNVFSGLTVYTPQDCSFKMDGLAFYGAGYSGGREGSMAADVYPIIKVQCQDGVNSPTEAYRVMFPSERFLRHLHGNEYVDFANPQGYSGQGSKNLFKPSNNAETARNLPYVVELDTSTFKESYHSFVELNGTGIINFPTDISTFSDIIKALPDDQKISAFFTHVQSQLDQNPNYKTRILQQMYGFSHMNYPSAVTAKLPLYSSGPKYSGSSNRFESGTIPNQILEKLDIKFDNFSLNKQGIQGVNGLYFYNSVDMNGSITKSQCQNLSYTASNIQLVGSNNLLGQAENYSTFNHAQVDVIADCDGTIKSKTIQFTVPFPTGQGLIEVNEQQGIRVYDDRYYIHYPMDKLPIDKELAAIDFGSANTTTITIQSESTPNELAPLTTSGTQLGQVDQLYVRLTEALDDHYQGRDNWINDPNAKIDLINHSQGGLITRLMIDQYRSSNLANPVNHINQIINYDTPHFGSAFAMDDADLMADTRNKAYPDIQFKVLGDNRQYLIDQDFYNPIASIRGDDIIRGQAFGKDVHFDFGAEVVGPVLGPYSGQFGIAQQAVGSLFLPEINQGMKPIRDYIRMLRQNSTHLRWPDATGAENVATKLFKASYPTTPSNGAKIPMTNFYSPSVGNFLEQSITDVWNNTLYPTCLEKLNMDIGFASLHPGYSCSHIFESLNEEFSEIKNWARKLDQNWSMKSDFVVEAESQQGLRIGSDFDPSINPNFNAINIGNNLHFPLSQAKAKGLNSATEQVCPSLTQLGVSCTQIARYPKAPLSSLDFVESKMIDPAKSQIVLRLNKVSDAVATGVDFNYYIHKVGTQKPAVKSLGRSFNSSVSDVGALWKININDPSVQLSANQTSPEYAFEISYAPPSIHYSMPSSLDWKRTTLVEASSEGSSTFSPPLPSSIELQSINDTLKTNLCPSNAVTSIASAKCNDYFVQNQIVYQCISSAEGCGNTQSTGIYCSNIPVDYTYWGKQAWKELGSCVQ